MKNKTEKNCFRVLPDWIISCMLVVSLPLNSILLQIKCCFFLSILFYILNRLYFVNIFNLIKLGKVLFISGAMLIDFKNIHYIKKTNNVISAWRVLKKKSISFAFMATFNFTISKWNSVDLLRSDKIIFLGL